MQQTNEPEREDKVFRERLSRLSEASLRINESLDFDDVLQSVLDSARSLTGARFGTLTLLDDRGQIDDFLSSGLTPQEAQAMWDLPDALTLFEHLGNIPEPLRLPDLIGHIREFNLPEPPLPGGAHIPLSFLAAPIHHGGERVGNIFLAETGAGKAFSAEDEETLVMFACQAALVIANARRYREEQRARIDLETLINTSPVGMAVLDATTGALVSFNREAQRIVDGLLDPDQAVAHLLEIVTVRRGDGSEVSLKDLPLAQALRAGETVRAEEIVLTVPDGRTATILINATPIRADDGELETFVVTMQDMMPLEEMERLRAEFLGMVSHELRTPLTSIKGSTTVLMDESTHLGFPEMRQFHRIIDDQTDHMIGLINDLLDVARIETGTLPVAPEPADVAVLVDQARNRFLSGGGRSNFHIDLAPDLPLVMADRRRVVQVLTNLLANAARYSPEASPIRVKVAREGVHVLFSVTDEGRGIPAERLPRLFRKFSQAEGEDEGGDTGLGLAICKGVVEAHGGRIWAESEGAGLGSRFSFTIPAAAPTAPAQPASRMRRREMREQPRVLVVDDDPHMLRYVRDALSKSGYTSIVTGDPEEALRLMEEERPHLALLDLVLPGSDGIALMEDILATADVPVIILSVYGEDGSIAKAFERGADDYVVKPFSPTELAARVGAALRRRTTPERELPTEPYVLGDLAVNYVERRVTAAGREVRLSVTEYDVLVGLSLSAGMVVTHEQLLQRVWGPGNSGDAGLVRTVVQRLRRKLGDDADNSAYIFTEPRVGYRMPRGETPSKEPPATTP
ncbi:MAG: ATP-binding protein [Caldilineaceae bacterium]|nr:ATP-binding protein [Caldilineaceae bacterium]